LVVRQKAKKEKEKKTKRSKARSINLKKGGKKHPHFGISRNRRRAPGERGVKRGGKSTEEKVNLLGPENLHEEEIKSWKRKRGEIGEPLPTVNSSGGGTHLGRERPSRKMGKKNEKVWSPGT